MNQESTLHIPVLLEEIIKYAEVETGENKIIDGTIGYGGHSENLLKINPLNQLLGVDRDVTALNFTKKRLEQFNDRITLRNGSYSNLAKLAKDNNWLDVDLILLDIGISSPQIDNKERGFSHRFEGPLDMRMDSQNPKTASRIVNTYSFEALSKIFRDYGEIIQSKKLADAIINARKEKLLSTTLELKEICEDVLGKPRPGTLPKSTLCFQALRIEVNDELNELKKGINEGLKLLKPGGHFLIITFHSLEDRIVKNMFRTASIDCICPPGLPLCVCKHKKSVKLITKKPVIAGETEIGTNRRAGCAKLRIIKKV